LVSADNLEIRFTPVLELPDRIHPVALSRAGIVPHDAGGVASSKPVFLQAGGG